MRATIAEAAFPPVASFVIGRSANGNTDGVERSIRLWGIVTFREALSRPPPSARFFPPLLFFPLSFSLQ